MDEMRRVPADTVKQPAAAAPGQGNRTTGVPAACSVVVPISIAVAATMFEPEMTTKPPPATGPIAGLATMPLGAVGSVPATVTGSVSGLASFDETREIDAFCTVVAVIPVPVTIATTVMTGRAVPLVNDDPLVVHVTVCATGAAQTHPVPYAPTGTTPVGVVCVIEIGAASLAPACTLVATL